MPPATDDARLAEDERRAEEVYEHFIRPALRPEDEGKYVAVAVESGDFEIDADDYAATGRLLARHPGARLWADADRAVRGVPAPRPRGGPTLTDRGAVNKRLEAIVPLRVRGPMGDELEVSAVIDTGYTGSLTLPAGVAASLGLPRRSGGRAVLADGSVRRFDTFAAEVLWNGSWVGVVASAVGGESLIGMSLLSGAGTLGGGRARRGGRGATAGHRAPLA